MCARIVLTSRAGTVLSLRAAFSLRAFYTQPSSYV